MPRVVTREIASMGNLRAGRARPLRRNFSGIYVGRGDPTPPEVPGDMPFPGNCLPPILQTKKPGRTFRSPRRSYFFGVIASYPCSLFFGLFPRHWESFLSFANFVLPFQDLTNCSLDLPSGSLFAQKHLWNGVMFVIKIVPGVMGLMLRAKAS